MEAVSRLVGAVIGERIELLPEMVEPPLARASTRTPVFRAQNVSHKLSLAVHPLRVWS